MESVDAPSPPQADAKARYNCHACGGERLAGSSAYKLIEPHQIQLATRREACWNDRATGATMATKCGHCKKLIFPNDEQLRRMRELKIDVRQEAQLREAEAIVLLPHEEALSLLTPDGN
jgi:hypothetical protein